MIQKSTIVVLGTTVALTIGVLVPGVLVPAVAQAGLPEPEWLQGGKSITSISFSITAGTGELILGSSKLTWSGVRGEGDLEAPNKITKFKLWFTGSAIGSCTVNSPGAKTGEVITKELRAKLGYLNESTPLVGVLLESAGGPSSTFLEVATSSCHASKTTVLGSVIGKISPIDKETSKFVVSFRDHSGEQEYTKFEGESEKHLLEYTEGSSAGSAIFQCGEEQLSLAGGLEVEIKT